MRVLAHGVELSAEGKPVALRFGILNLLYRLYAGSGTCTERANRAGLAKETSIGSLPAQYQSPPAML
jgi:hypothetical protein